MSGGMEDAERGTSLEDPKFLDLVLKRLPEFIKGHDEGVLFEALSELGTYMKNGHLGKHIENPGVFYEENLKPLISQAVEKLKEYHQRDEERLRRTGRAINSIEDEFNNLAERYI